MPSLPTSYKSDDPTASNTETSYVPSSPTFPLIPGVPIHVPRNSPTGTGYTSLNMLYYLRSRIDELNQQEGVRAAVVNEAQAACHNQIDELECLVARLQTRSEVQALRIRSSRTTDPPSTYGHRQEMIAALTDQVQILRDILEQLRISNESALKALDATTDDQTQDAERTSRRRNNRNSERRSRGNGARILYIREGPSPNAPTFAQRHSYCHYHQRAGHETAECRQLKDAKSRSKTLPRRDSAPRTSGT
ncbi:hypothetical protein Bca4012_020393 [Brassica carinata]